MKKIFIFLIILFLFSGCGSNENVNIMWTPPLDGAQVDHYILVVDSNDGQQVFTTNKIVYPLAIKSDYTYIAKVAAVGISGKIGEFSEPSDPFNLNNSN